MVAILGDRYRVVMGALTMIATEDELRAVGSEGRTAKRRRAARERSVGGDDAPGGPDALRRAGSGTPAPRTRRVDLHGMTTDAAREAVVAAVDAAILAGEEALEIVHGIGTGRVREAAWAVLKTLPVVRHIRAHPTNRGVTVVQM